MKLKDLSTIRTGLVLSRKQAEKQSDIVIEYELLTLRSVKDTGQINLDQLEKYEAKELLNSDFITKKSDIIARLSAPYTSVLIDEKTENLVISSHFVIIRADKNKILPEYLYWLLNTEKIKTCLLQNSLGSTLAVIKPSSFGEIDIFEFDIKKQETVSQINLLNKKEIALLEELKTQKAKLNTALMNKIQKELRSK